MRNQKTTHSHPGNISRRQILLAGALLPVAHFVNPHSVAAQNEPKQKMMSDNNDVYDCVIVGGGVAGLSAALLLGRARRRVLVCDKGKPRNAPAHESHSFLTRDGTPPPELLRIAREQLTPYRTVEYQTVGVRDIRKAGAQFEVVFEDGTTRESRKILFAFGVVDEFPPVENFADFWGQSVFHCPFCHGYELRDQPLAVIGRGEVGFGKVALLRSWSRDLVLCTDGDSELSLEQKRLLQKYQVPVREEKITRFEGAGGQLERIVFASGDSILRQGALVQLKQHLRSYLATKLGCELNDFGLLKVDALGATSVPGVYAAGDCTTPMQSLANAVAQGAVAAGGGITHALIKEDFA